MENNVKMKQQGTFSPVRYNVGASCKGLSLDDAFFPLVLVSLCFSFSLIKERKDFRS